MTALGLNFFLALRKGPVFIATYTRKNRPTA